MGVLHVDGCGLYDLSVIYRTYYTCSRSDKNERMKGNHFRPQLVDDPLPLKPFFF